MWLYTILYIQNVFKAKNHLLHFFIIAEKPSPVKSTRRYFRINIRLIHRMFPISDRVYNYKINLQKSK